MTTTVTAAEKSVDAMGAANAVQGTHGAESPGGGDRAAHWRAVAAATGPADRAAAEAGVRLAYEKAGLAPPERIVWTGSPLEGTAAAMLLAGQGGRPAGEFAGRAVRALEAAGVEPVAGGAGASVREAVRTRPWARARGRLHDELGPSGWAACWALTAAPLWEVTGALVERIRTGVIETLTEGPGTESAVRLAMLEAVSGQHDAPWLAALTDAAAANDTANTEAAVTGDKDAGPDALAGVAAVARAAGWWWPYEKAVVIAERPVELHRDEAGRLDRADGPALAFPDGFALYAWRGMPVPAEFLGGLGGLTPERIRAEENAELRRVMLEHYGYQRYLDESGARPVHRDETGVLWRIELPDDEPVVMVEVVNSTPEPDGTHRTYWLRVPPRTRSAREGVAWTFGLDADSYLPERET